MNPILKQLVLWFMLLPIVAGIILYYFPSVAYYSATRAIRLWAGLKRYEMHIDDHRWVYLAGGHGETILFIHGFGADKDRWGTLLPAFSGSFRVVAPDLPGFGESSKIASAKYDIPNQVRRLNRFVEAAGLASFHLLGVSLGGYISALYAAQYPSKVKSLALMDPAGIKSPVPSDAMKAYEKSGRIPLLYKTSDQFTELLSFVLHRPPWMPDRYKAYFARNGAANYDFNKKILEDIMASGIDLLNTGLSEIQAPTLIIWGADDRVIHPSSVGVFKAKIKNVRTVVFKDCGHVPFFEKPKETKSVYKAFLATVQ